MNSVHQIDSVHDNIHFLEREPDEWHYEFYVCHCKCTLFQYELISKELDNQRNELVTLKNKVQN